MLEGRWGRIFACSEPLDMRKSYYGLLGAVRERLEADALSGDLYVFINRRRTIIKCLWWDRTGWSVLAKKLERRRFELRESSRKQELTKREFEFLLDGILRKNSQSSTVCTIQTE